MKLNKFLIILSILFCSIILWNCDDDDPVSPAQKDTLYISDTSKTPDTVFLNTSDTVFLGKKSPSYVGSKSCDTCHPSEYKRHSQSGHPFKLNVVNNGVPPVYPSFVTVPPPTLPPEVWKNVSYVIGGYLKSSMLINNTGHLLAGPAPQEYKCGKCHTTGYVPFGHQDNLPGIIGTWAEPGIQCEACHGPGSQHIESHGLIPAEVDQSADQCKKCHIRGTPDDLQAKFGLSDSAYLLSHSQYNEFAHSKMSSMSCVSCHDPHSSTHYDSKAEGKGIHTDCATCHLEEAISYRNGTNHFDSAGIGCVKCHMPKIPGSSPTHLFRIATDTNMRQFKNDSTSNPWIALKTACMGCHGDTTYPDMPKALQSRTLSWAASFAKSIHRPKAPAKNKYAGKDICANCHSGTVNGWSRSAHGLDFRAKKLGPNTYDFIHGTMNNNPAFGASCQACHVTGYGEPTGWTDDVHKSGATTADSMRLESVQCEACHGPSSQHATNGAPFEEKVDYNSSCQKCHVGHYDQDISVLGSADSLEVTKSTGLKHPQGLIYNGVKGYEYPGKTYNHSAHATQITRGCVTCHMYKGTGHRLNADKEACISCHGTRFPWDSITVSGADTLHFNYRGVQDTVNILISQLNTLLTRSLTPALTAADSATVKGAFPYKAAQYNLNSVIADKSRGIHDYKYTRQLLSDAIADSSNYLNIIP